MIESRDFWVSSRSNTGLLFLTMIFNLRTSWFWYLFYICLLVFVVESRDFWVSSRSMVIISKHDFPSRYVTVSIFSCFMFVSWCL